MRGSTKKQMKISSKINGKNISDEIPVSMTLVEFLHCKGFWSVKIGCETGDCGSCTVSVDGRALHACSMLAVQVEGKVVETYEQVVDSKELGPLKEALMNNIDMECGYCLPGLMIALKTLIDHIPDPTEEEVADALSGNICRCVQAMHPVQDIMDALQKMRGNW